MAVKKDPRTLELAEPFVSLFPVDPTTLKLVTDSIRERGFQADKPLLVWKDAFGDRGRPVVVDGHTRLRAALDLKLKEIPANMRQFKNVDAAITAGVGEQVQRRNLNREQIAAYVVSILPMLDETKDGLKKRTTKQLAAMLGVSTATIDRARGVLASNNEVLIEAVKSGGMSLLAAYGEVTGNPQWANPQAAPSEELAPAGHELTAEQAESLKELAVDVGRALTPEPAPEPSTPTYSPHTPGDTPGSRAILAQDSPDLLALLEDGKMTFEDAWLKRGTRIRLTTYLVEYVQPLLGKSDPAGLIEHYQPRFHPFKIGLPELDEAISYLQALRLAMSRRTDIVEAPDAS